MSVWRPALGLVVAGFLLGATAALSQWQWSAKTAERSVLRLSWRARGERLESCRRATPEELAAVPAHMRQEVICEGARVAPYRLRIAVDGQALEVRRDAWRAADQRYYASDTKRFRDATGWAPRVGVREGVQRLRDWLAADRRLRPAAAPELTAEGAR